MKQATVVSHPLLEHSLTILRDKTTKTEEFRRHARVVSTILVLEALKGVELKDKAIETPLSKHSGKEIADNVIVVPVLRAGLSMSWAFEELLPWVSVGLIGLERDEKTAIAREYYKKFPTIGKDDLVCIVDPMLATGGSMDDTITAVKKMGVRRIICVAVVSAPEGIDRLTKHHPDVPIVTGAIDDHLNDIAYIVPGLGDFGDRYFGT
jgi:uracil phosphoribosyltransferase